MTFDSPQRYRRRTAVGIGARRAERGRQRRERSRGGVGRKLQPVGRGNQQGAVRLLAHVDVEQGRQRAHLGIALVLQVGGTLALRLEIDDLRVERTDVRKRAVQRADVALDGVLNVLPGGADRRAQRVDLVRQVHRGGHDLLLLRLAGRLVLQRGEGVLQVAEQAGQVGAGRHRALHGVDARQRSLPRLQSGDDAVLLIKLALQRVVHSACRRAGDDAHALAVRRSVGLRRHFRCIAGGVGIGDVLRNDRKLVADVAQRTAGDGQAGIQAHGRCSVPRRLLRLHVEIGVQHVVGRRHDLGVGRIGLLGHDQAGELGREVDVGFFK